MPFSTIHFREDREFWEKWFPADFITESFPGQFRNWFYAMLAMSTVLRRTAPFKTIFGYGTLVGEDGRPMHKSWGNSIEFDEAAERMGVDVMRWMYASARPEDNILFGWHTADGARRRLLGALEHVLVLRDLRAARRLDAERLRRRPSRRWIAGCWRAWPDWRPRSRTGSRTSTRRPRRA